jgi:hypothetical protein
MSSETILHLHPKQFSELEKPLVESGELAASSFRFSSGVRALRLKNGLGELVVLPFQGQQIWDATFLGRRLTMKSMFAQPYPTTDFLATFGGFLQHCGATAMGSPGPQDHHPLHGELPNAPYQSAHLVSGEDEKGAYLGLGGEYRHTLAFSYDYLARPQVKIYAGSAIAHVSMTITNLKNSPMPLMYLAHINFRPVDNGRLVYTALCDPQHMRVRTDAPGHVQAKPGYREFLQELSAHPEKHLVLKPGLAFDPEVVFLVDNLKDAEGWTHGLQVHPDGSADVVRHRPDQLAHGIRWICRTADQDALGMEAGTAEVSGYSAEVQKGFVRDLGPGEVFHCDLQAGALTPKEAKQVEAFIQKIVGK